MTSPPVPPQAITAATEALRNEGTQGQLEALAAITLEAAWPYLAADVLARIEQGLADGAAEVITQAVEAERERCAAAIEAAIVTDPAGRYALWPSREGETSYPDACAEAMNSVTTQDGYEEWWPVIQAGAFWNALEPVILHAAAGIARHGLPVPSGDSDIQPDPYIDAIAAGHVQEYDPAPEPMAADVTAAAVAAERAALCEVLAGHYLATITCDHERKRDRPECACSLVDLGWHPSVGEAVQAWVRHVMWQRSAALLRQAPP